MRDYCKLGLYDTPVELSGSDVSFSPEWEPIETVHELRGVTKRYLTGFRFKATLAVKFIPAAASELLRAAYTSYLAGSPIYFWPYPDTYPQSFYRVEWMNGWRLPPINALAGQGRAGTIELRGTDILSSTPIWSA